MACELARHGVRPRIIDRLKQPSPYCRAIGVTTRTLEVWEDMGIAREMIDAGIWIEGSRTFVVGQIVDTRFDLSDLPFANLGLPQNDTERVLTRHLASLGVEIERGVTLESLTQTDGEVETVLARGPDEKEEARFRYVIGCDGAHSAVRRALGISFEGSPIPAEFMLGDVHIDWTTPRGMVMRIFRPGPNGMPDFLVAVPLPEIGRYRVSILSPPELAAPAEGTGHGIQSERPAPGIAPLQAAVDRLLPEKAVLSDLRWSSIFRISMRLASKYRQGNVFIAGDAAHIHPPTGGQGMNTGIQDAYNLGWKLALVLNGVGRETILDSYEAERHPVGKDVVDRTSRAIPKNSREDEDRLTDTQVLISYRGSPWIENSPNGAQPVGPAAGDRAPDCQGLRRTGVGFPFRLFDVLRGAEHVLVVYCTDSDPDPELADLAAFGTELQLADALRFAAIVKSAAKATKLPPVPFYEDAGSDFEKTYGSGQTAMLVRPDGYLSWRGDSWRESELRRQLERIFRL